jgi:ubiquinone/menaquinone biosynthesis C-methylase UbiE
MTIELYYDELAVAFVRGRLGCPVGSAAAAVLQAGIDAGLRLHHFKRTAGLPRVQKVLGILRGLAPTTLLDVGSGRGVFLWPLLDTFPDLHVTTIDTDARHVADVEAVRAGGVARVRAVQMDAQHLEFPDRTFDIVTALEVLEHLARPDLAAAEALRVARRFVVVSVPSHADDNPQHLRLFKRDTLEALLTEAGARRVQIDYVLNHMIAVARVDDGAAPS